MRVVLFILLIIKFIVLCKSNINIEQAKSGTWTCDENSAKQIFLNKIKSVEPKINVHELVVRSEYWEKENVFFFSVTTDSISLITKGYISIVNKNDCTIREFARTM